MMLEHELSMMPEHMLMSNARNARNGTNAYLLTFNLLSHLRIARRGVERFIPKVDVPLWVAVATRGRWGDFDA